MSQPPWAQAMWKTANQMFLVTTCVLASSSILLSQTELNSTQGTDNPATSEIGIPFGWDKGDSYQYSVERRKGTGPVKRQLFSIEIVSSTEEFVTAKCNIEIVSDPDQRKEQESVPAVKQLLDLYRDLDVLVRIGKDGVFLGVENSNELKKVFDKTVGPSMAAIDSANLDPEKKEIARRLLKETVNLERFQQELLAPLHRLLMLTGTSHPEAEPFERELTNDMLYASAVPMTETYTVTNHDRAKKNVTIQYSLIADSDEAARLVTEAMMAFIQRMSPGSKEEVVVEGVVYQTQANFTISTETGWPDAIQWRERVNNFTDGKLVDKTFVKISRVKANP